MERVCRKCNGTEFYSNGQCKQCARKNATNYRAADLERARAYDRERAKDPERKRRFAAWLNGHWERHPKIRKAQIAVGNALRDGKLLRQPCEICATTTNVHGHHDDYDHPLTVRWLCVPHHAQWHQENGPGRNIDMAIKGIRNTSQLTALECADRIRTELADKPARIAKRKEAVETEENERSSARIKALLDRCVPEQRDDLPRILNAIRCPLNGIELQPGNDASPPDQPTEAGEDDGIPVRLKEPVPPLRQGERRTVERS